MSGRDERPSTEPPGGRQAPPVDGPLMVGGKPLRPGDRVGDYVFEQEIGSGAMARVLLARTPDGQRLALKLLRADRMEAGLARFRREYHVLAGLHHPNIVQVHGYGDLDGVPYIAMEFVDGADLHQVIRELRTLDPERRWSRVRGVLIDLCRALSALHRRGLVHRDLKPSNVLVMASGVCKLTDFGIVKDLEARVDVDGSKALVGTWAYASPEHIGGQPVDHRSDLYGLGVILFALLTGKRPFVADDMAGYLEAHRRQPVPRASSVVADVPPVLEEICERLLAKAPRDRFQSAREVLYRLDADDLDDPDEAQDVWQPPWLGPREVMDRVDEIYAGLGRREGALVRVVAADGLGRSRLLAETVGRARSAGFPFYHLVCVDDASPWTQPLALGRELCRELDDVDDLPLRDLLAATQEGTGRSDLRHGLGDALADALERLAQRRPRVLVIDDLHLAPLATRELFRSAIRKVCEANIAVAVVVASRTNEIEIDGWTRRIQPVDIALVPLAEADVVAIVGSLIGGGRSAEVLGQRLHRDAEGNPSFVVEFLRSLVGQGLVVRADRGWRLVLQADEIAAGRLEIPPSIRAVLRRRVSACAPSDRELLDVLALSAVPPAPALVADVLDREPLDVAARLARLASVGLAQRAGEVHEPTWSLAHAALQEVLRLDMPSSRAVALHRALAVALEAQGGFEPEHVVAIGEHHRQAGDAARAYAFLCDAAAVYAVGERSAEAAEVVQRALSVEAAAHASLEEGAWADLRGQLLRSQARSEDTRAMWHEALTSWTALRELAETRQDEPLACEARVGIASVLGKLGRVAEARAEGRAVLAVARRLKHRSAVAEALVALARIAWAEGDRPTAEQLAQEGLLVAQGPGLAAARGQLLLVRARVQILEGQLASASRGCVEAEVLFRERGMLAMQVHALALLARLHLWSGDVDTARKRSTEALTLSERVESPQAQCAALQAYGMTQLELGEGCAAHDALLNALSLAQRYHLDEQQLGAGVALVRLAIDRSDLVTAQRVGAELMQVAPEHDAERVLPLLHTLLARVLGRKRPTVAVELLRSGEATLASQPPPRRQQIRLAAAQAWHALGDRERAIGRAKEVVQDPAGRTFRFQHIEARALLTECTLGEESTRHRKAGVELIREISEAIDPVAATMLGRRPAFRVLVPSNTGSVAATRG